MDLFLNGLDLTDKTQPKSGAINVNDFIKEGNFFLMTSDTSNMPSNYNNQWVWLFVKRYNTRVLQIMLPDSCSQGWIALRTIALDNGKIFSDWSILDFKNKKILIGGVKAHYRLYVNSLKEVA